MSTVLILIAVTAVAYTVGYRDGRSDLIRKVRGRK